MSSPPRSAANTRKTRSWRSEEHTSELQSLRHLVCRLLLEKKNYCSLTLSFPAMSINELCTPSVCLGLTYSLLTPTISNDDYMSDHEQGVAHEVMSTPSPDM